MKKTIQFVLASLCTASILNASDAEKINAPNDLRELYFRIEELKLESI